MKKFLFFALAAAFALTSCNNDETLATAQNGAIGFDVAADKATRSYDPSITTANITNFAVYGWMNDYTGVVFRDELVSNNGSGWTYQNTQYWVAGNNYYFAALAPSNDRAWTLTEANSDEEAQLGIGQVNFKNDGTQDLLYWAQGPIVGQASSNPVVGIVFNHLLSKVKFTFANQFDNENVSIVVRNIVINQHPSEADIDLATANWYTDLKAWKYVEGQVANYEFGNAVKAESAIDAEDKIGQYESLSSYNEVLLFPFENQLFNITYEVDLYMGQEKAATYEHTVPLTTTLKMGYAYNFKASFNAKNITGKDDETLEPIEFTVEVIKDWMLPGEDVNLNYELIDTEEVVNNKTLTSDAVISGNLTVGGVFDGAGFTVTPSNPVVTEDNVYPFITLVPGAKVQNVTIDGQNASIERNDTTFGIRALFINKAGEYTIDNVRVYNVTYPLHVATTSKVDLNITNSILEGWTSYNPETTVNFTGVSFENGTYARLRPYGNTTLTNCSFEAGFVIDLKYVAEGKKVTFVNCKYADQPLTAENLTDEVDGKFEIK